MASIQQQDTLEDRLSDIEYKNWLKAALCLFCVKEGLESFVEQESDALHKTLLALYQPCGNCTQDDIKKLCFDCEDFKSEIKKLHKCSNPSWNNTDVQNWLHDHWSVARCFMNPGQSQHTSASDDHADISALLNFINNCTVFQDKNTYGDIQQDAEKVREHRNEIFHRGKDKLQNKALNDWTMNMIQLLKNKNPDGKLKSNSQAKKARKTIKKILGEEITISLKDEHKIQITVLQAQMTEVKNELQEKDEKLQTLQNESISQGQNIHKTAVDIQTLITDSKNLRSTLHKIHENLDVVRARITTKDEEFCKITAAMKDYDERLEKLESDLQAVKNYLQDKVSHKDLTKVQKAMIAYYKLHHSIQLNPVFVGGKTCRDLGGFYTNMALEEGTEERLKGKRRKQQKKTEQVNSFRQLFEKDGYQITRTVLRGEAGLGKSTFLKKLLTTWCTFQNNRLNKVREGLESPVKVSFDEMKDGDIMMKFDILLCVNLGKISDEKDFIDVIYKQVPVLNTPPLSREYLDALMREDEDNKVLMLMDGLDEMDASASCAPYIEQIVKGEEYPNMTVIVASRPWKIDRLHQSEPPAHVDVMIDMKGFSKKNSKLFAGKIFKNYYEDVDETAIEKFWNDVRACDIAKDFIHVPLIMLFLVHVWYQDKSFPQTLLHLYFKMLDILVNRYVEKQKVKKTEVSQISSQVRRLKDLPKLQKLSITETFGEEFLLAFCEVAAQFLFNEKQERALVFEEKDLLHQLGDDGQSKLQLALEIGLLSKNDCTEAHDDTRKVSISFPHMTIQELLAAIHLYCNESHFSHFLGRLKTYHDVLQNEVIIKFIAGISPQRCEKIFEKIFETCDDEPVYKSIYMTESRHFLPAAFCKLYMKCLREADEKSTCFRLKHLYAASLHELNAVVSRIKNITDIRSLILKNIDFTLDKCKSSLDISKCDNLKCLVLEHITMDNVDMILSVFPQLLEIVLNWLTLSSENSVLLCDMLLKCTQLQKLTINCVQLDNGTLDLSGASCLSELELFDVTISSINLSQCTQLQKLTLQEVKLGDCKLDLLQCTQLQKLTLYGVNLGDGKLDFSGSYCLCELELHYVTISNISHFQCTQLQKLTLNHVSLGDGKLDLSGASYLYELDLSYDTISSISLSQCTQLQRLKLDHVNLGDGKLDLSGAFCLSELTLYKLTMSNESAVQLCNSLSHNNRQLKRLNLEDMDLGDALLDLNKLPPNIGLDMYNVLVSSQCVDLLEAQLCVRGVEMAFIEHSGVTSQDRRRFTCFCHAIADLENMRYIWENN